MLAYFKKHRWLLFAAPLPFILVFWIWFKVFNWYTKTNESHTYNKKTEIVAKQIENLKELTELADLAKNLQFMGTYENAITVEGIDDYDIRHFIIRVTKIPDSLKYTDMVIRNNKGRKNFYMVGDSLFIIANTGDDYYRLKRGDRMSKIKNNDTLYLKNTSYKQLFRATIYYDEEIYPDGFKTLDTLNIKNLYQRFKEYNSKARTPISLSKGAVKYIEKRIADEAKTN